MKISNLLIILTFFFISISTAFAQEPVKREFRGAWFQTVYQDQYARMSRGEMQKYITDLLDKMHTTGINAIIFPLLLSFILYIIVFYFYISE